MLSISYLYFPNIEKRIGIIANKKIYYTNYFIAKKILIIFTCQLYGIHNKYKTKEIWKN